MGPKPNLEKAQETTLRTTKCGKARNRREAVWNELAKTTEIGYEVCAEAQSKYKCPTCLIPCCSVVCFKKHKEIPCKKLESPVEVKVCEATATSPIVNDEKPLYVEEPSEVLQGVQLESIASSSEIRDEDEKLKKLICDIDSALDPEKELHKVMEAEEFRLFTEKILATITP